MKKKLFQNALAVAEEVAKYKDKKKSPPFFLILRLQVAQRTVFQPIRKKMGGSLRFSVSGGAPLDPKISRFFAACGIPLMEGYGLSESTGPIFVNTLFNHKSGTVGQAIGDVQVQIGENNEILVKSDKIMKGYFKDPEATKAATTKDGFFKTGDVGEIDSDGFLKITDRLKDLIKTANGKFVAPQKLQKHFASSPLISFVHVHGDKQKYMVALLTIDPDALEQMKIENNLQDQPQSLILRDPKIETKIRQEVSRINRGLASFETIKRYKVLDHEFSIEGGQLTPSLKMKRKHIDKIYADEIQGLYL